MWAVSPAYARSTGAAQPDFLVRGHISGETSEVLDIELVEASSGECVLQDRFAGKYPLESYSSSMEMPLARASAAARAIAEFIAANPKGSQEPEIVLRSEWHARDPKERLSAMRYAGDLDTLLNWIAVHHTGYTPSGPKEVQLEHMLPEGDGEGQHPFGRNWYDAGYHFMIDRNGAIYQGRELDFIGSHVGAKGGGGNIRLNPNFGTIGIAVFGHFGAAHPSSRQAASLCWLLNHLSTRFKIPADHVIGHRELPGMLKLRKMSGKPTDTICPGEHLQAVVDRWRLNHTAGDTEEPPE